MKRRITLETEKIVIRGGRLEYTRCEACGASGPSVTAEQAAILLGEEIADLCLRAESGQIHSTRTPAGVLMICLRSLSAVTGSDWRTQLRAGPLKLP